MLKSLLYVSRSRLDTERAHSQVAVLVARSRCRNAQDGLTGALIFTGGGFAQCLEGQAAEVDRAMARIAADFRHEGLTVLAEEACQRRRFADWDMAYGGPSTFVDRHVQPLLHVQSPEAQAEGAEALLEIMVAFTREGAGGR